MTLVRLTTDRASATFTQRHGDLIELPDSEARALVAARQAEWVEAESKPAAPRRSRARQSDSQPTSKETI